VVSWTSPTSGKTYVSRYSTENTPIEDVIIRNWAQEIWRKERGVRTVMGRLYNRTPERTEVPSLDPESVDIIKTTYEPQVIGRPYYYGEREVLALDRRFRDLNKSRAKRLLIDAGMDETDAEQVANFMKSDPMWDLESGESVQTSSPEEQNIYLNQTASMGPDMFFQEGLISYMMEPYVLAVKDPELYDYMKINFFNSKEFK